ncbi:MAG: FtsX-like permease family protein [Bacilli bacterium]|nr:FtsX-like permease family protein [Bacilli bacterium]
MNILNKLTIKHLTMNKKRTLVTILGVALSCALMVGIGLIFSSIRDYAIKEVKVSNGSHHAKILSLSKNDLLILEDNDNIKNIMYERNLGFALLEGSKNEYKPYLYINGVNQAFLSDLKIIDGRLPENEKEVVISNHIINNANVKYKVGDILKLDVGNRLFNDLRIEGNTSLILNNEKSGGETFIADRKVEYKVVGIVERHHSENYDAAGYSIFTLDKKLEPTDFINVYITYKKINDVFDKTKEVAKELKIAPTIYGEEEVYDNIRYNQALLSLYGQNEYDNYDTGVIKIIIVMLSLVSIGCIFVIYNSFAISVMERKKQFGLFSSIGATRRQLQKTVFYESFLIGLIGIPLGIISGFIGIGIVLQIINYLLPEIFVMNLQLSFYPLFIIIPVIFMIIVIVFSAFLPARSASKISPIEAIRLNDDIKINPKKIKSPKLITRLFGIEGEVAFKNIKRNKKKYRITIISLFVSIVLFISFSSFLQYGEASTREFLEITDYDIGVGITPINNQVVDQLVKEVRQQDYVTNIIHLEHTMFFTPKIKSEYFHKDYQDLLDIYKDNDIEHWASSMEYDYINLYKVDNITYQKYKELLNIKEDQPILINQFEERVIVKNKSIKVAGKQFKNLSSLNIDICTIDFGDNENTYNCIDSLTNITEVTTVPFGMKSQNSMYGLKIILPANLFNEYVLKNQAENPDRINLTTQIYIETDNPTKTEEVIEKYKDKTEDIESMYITNVAENMRLERNLMIVVKLLLYGFISLVTLIGVTSVFNTINTSIALRRKEFAVFRSIGLTPSGFNKMIRFEILIFGLKSLLYAIPASIGVIILIHSSMGEVIHFSSMMLPWGAIITAILGVFAIITITMNYATKKIKNENILDAIREENI